MESEDLLLVYLFLGVIFKFLLGFLKFFFDNLEMGMWRWRWVFELEDGEPLISLSIWIMLRE